MTSMVRGQGSNQYQDKMRPDDPRLAVPGQQAFMPNGAPAYDEDAYQSLMKIVGPIGMENELHSYAAHVPQYGDARAIPAAHVPQIASFGSRGSGDSISECGGDDGNEILQGSASLLFAIEPLPYRKSRIGIESASAFP